MTGLNSQGETRTKEDKRGSSEGLWASFNGNDDDNCTNFIGLLDVLKKALHVHALCDVCRCLVQ